MRLEIGIFGVYIGIVRRGLRSADISWFVAFFDIRSVTALMLGGMERLPLSIFGRQALAAR